MHRLAAALTRRRWHGNLRVAMAAALLAALALSLAPTSPARATPLAPFIDLEERGLTMRAAGVGLQGLGASTRNLSVTIGGPVRAAVLYWAGQDRPCPENPPGVCVIPAQPYKDQQLRFDGVAIIGTIIGAETQPVTAGGPVNNIGYFADVTAIVAARGTGQQVFAVADGNTASNLSQLQGAGLLVLYTDPAAADAYRVIVFDGLDFAHGADPTPGGTRSTTPVTFNHGARGNARLAGLIIFAGGGTAERPDRLDIGNNPSVVNALDGSVGAAWDADTRSIEVPAGVGATTVQLVSEPADQNPDALLWTLSALRVPVTSDAPVAANDGYTTAQDTALSVPAPGVLANDSDVGGDPLAAQLGGGPSNGTLTLNPNGAFTYTPNAGFSGGDRFTYRASDGTNLSPPATVSITVTATPPPPAPTHTLTLSSTGGGSATGGGSYTPGSIATLSASPEAGQVFTGWTLDGQFVGWANPLTIIMNGNHTAAASFAPRPSFPDVPAAHPAAEAIGQLAARGIIKGYQDGRFGPGDSTLRAQMAALIARAMGWGGEDHGNTFPDRGSVDADLWRNVGTLAFYGVAKGYPDGSYKPTNPVLYAQTISFITRAMVAKGSWQAQPDNPALYPNVPASSGHRADLATYTFYAGAVPGTDPAATWGGWAQPATRGWFALAQWQALDSYFGVDRVP